MNTSITARARMPVSEGYFARGLGRLLVPPGSREGWELREREGMGTSESSQRQAHPLQAAAGERSPSVADPSVAPRQAKPVFGLEHVSTRRGPVLARLKWLTGRVHERATLIRTSINRLFSSPTGRASRLSSLPIQRTWTRKTFASSQPAGPTCRQHLTDLARARELGPSRKCCARATTRSTEWCLSGVLSDLGVVDEGCDGVEAELGVGGAVVVPVGDAFHVV